MVGILILKSFHVPSKMAEAACRDGYVRYPEQSQSCQLGSVTRRFLKNPEKTQHHNWCVPRNKFHLFHSSVRQQV